jgi:hypothetical protein
VTTGDARRLHASAYATTGPDDVDDRQARWLPTWQAHCRRRDHPVDLSASMIMIA